MGSNHREKDNLKKIILDTDTSTGILGAEIDDGFALLFCLGLEKLGKMKLLGITEVAGNTNVDQGVICALKMLEMTGREDIPVYKGIGKSLSIDHKPPFNPNCVDEPLTGNPKISKQQEHAIDFIIHMVKKFPNQITLVTIGPLMNIAMAIIKDPEIIPLIKEIVAMGGEFNGRFFPGGFNWWFCPHSARIVLRSGIPITIIPTDVTVKTALTLKQLDSLGESQLVLWCKKVSEPFMTIQVHEELGAYLHDPLAIAVTIDREIAIQTRNLYVDTIVEGPWAGYTIGQETTYGWAKPWGVLSIENIQRAVVVTEHDNEKYMNMFLNTMKTLFDDLLY